jgi:hypothetical protein
VSLFIEQAVELQAGDDKIRCKVGWPESEGICTEGDFF